MEMSSNIIQELTNLSLFGHVEPQNIVLHGLEEREKKERSEKQRKEVEKLRKQQEEKQKKEELELEEYHRENMMHQMKRDKALYAPPHKRGRGRGAVLSEETGVSNRPSDNHSRRADSDRSFFQREQKVQESLYQIESRLYSNRTQKSYWEEKASNNYRDENDNKAYLNYESSSNSDQYEDADSLNQTSSPSFHSVSSSLSPADVESPGHMSPGNGIYTAHVLEPSINYESSANVMCPAPKHKSASTSSPYKPKKSKLAAKFTNSFEDFDVEHKALHSGATSSVISENVNGQDPVSFLTTTQSLNGEDPLTGQSTAGSSTGEEALSVLTTARSSIYRRKGFRGVKNTLDSLNSSQRVLTNKFDAEAICKAYNNRKEEGYTFKKDDFPSL
ncbi:uncharacterized protein LOC129002071 [Macrosteles quadrilineatus]|uniref:uncharacterized protein LOC129002071 n=1 Tax=Macrosteles quadrilineatus TaxID=74068 RepID=UPI0023E22957|nr:uncharacterized protein LOC129002071 [Macrosteles quadrilineatus]